MSEVSIGSRVEMAKAIEQLQDIGKRAWSRPVFLKDAAVCFRADKQDVKGISKRSLAPAYIKGMISKYAGLTFQLVGEETVDKKRVVASVEVRVPRGEGVKTSVFIENYGKYYKVLQKTLDDV